MLGVDVLMDVNVHITPCYFLDEALGIYYSFVWRRVMCVVCLVCVEMCFRNLLSLFVGEYHCVKGLDLAFVHNRFLSRQMFPYIWGKTSSNFSMLGNSFGYYNYLSRPVLFHKYLVADRSYYHMLGWGWAFFPGVYLLGFLAKMNGSNLFIAENGVLYNREYFLRKKRFVRVFYYDTPLNDQLYCNNRIFLDDKEWLYGGYNVDANVGEVFLCGDVFTDYKTGGLGTLYLDSLYLRKLWKSNPYRRRDHYQQAYINRGLKDITSFYFNIPGKNELKVAKNKCFNNFVEKFTNPAGRIHWNPDRLIADGGALLRHTKQGRVLFKRLRRRIRSGCPGSRRTYYSDLGRSDSFQRSDMFFDSLKLRNSFLVENGGFSSSRYKQYLYFRRKRKRNGLSRNGYSDFLDSYLHNWQDYHYYHYVPRFNDKLYSVSYGVFKSNKKTSTFFEVPDVDGFGYIGLSYTKSFPLNLMFSRTDRTQWPDQFGSHRWGRRKKRKGYRKGLYDADLFFENTLDYPYFSAEILRKYSYKVFDSFNLYRGFENDMFTKQFPSNVSKQYYVDTVGLRDFHFSDYFLWGGMDQVDGRLGSFFFNHGDFYISGNNTNVFCKDTVLSDFIGKYKLCANLAHNFNVESLVGKESRLDQMFWKNRIFENCVIYDKHKDFIYQEVPDGKSVNHFIVVNGGTNLFNNNAGVTYSFLDYVLERRSYQSRFILDHYYTFVKGPYQYQVMQKCFWFSKYDLYMWLNVFALVFYLFIFIGFLCSVIYFCMFYKQEFFEPPKVPREFCLFTTDTKPNIPAIGRLSYRDQLINSREAYDEYLELVECSITRYNFFHVNFWPRFLRLYYKLVMLYMLKYKTNRLTQMKILKEIYLLRCQYSTAQKRHHFLLQELKKKCKNLSTDEYIVMLTNLLVSRRILNIVSVRLRYKLYLLSFHESQLRFHREEFLDRYRRVNELGYRIIIDLYWKSLNLYENYNQNLWIESWQQTLQGSRPAGWFFENRATQSVIVFFVVMVSLAAVAWKLFVFLFF